MSLEGLLRRKGAEARITRVKLISDVCLKMDAQAANALELLPAAFAGEGAQV